MKIVFRADASLDIGTGHVMRCLTLADALRQRGADCTFICRPHAGHLLEHIDQCGHKTLVLPVLTADAAPKFADRAHVAWLGTDWASDAQNTRLALGHEVVDWLVVDHYALDARWEKILRPTTRHIMVIDDLADRPHDCDLLLDQNLGRTAQDYTGLLNAETTTLIGPHYALLRPEFAALRTQSLARRTQNSQLKHLLITMGGVDKDNATGQVLDTLKTCALPHDLHITVVMGPHAPWLAQVRAQATQMPRPTRVLAGVSNIAQLMAVSDLAIGGAGGTAWERCCLGLPSLVLVLAENQQAGAAALQGAGAAIALEACQQITEALRHLQLAESANIPLLKLAQAAFIVTDGTGCAVIAQQLLNNHG